MPPPVKIPSELLSEYTMSGTVPIIDWYRDDSTPNGVAKWTNQVINQFLTSYSFQNIKSLNHIPGEPYEGSSKLHVQACEMYPDAVRDKNIAVIGSLTPWIEAILVNAGAKSVTTVEYNVPECEHHIIKTISYDEFSKSDTKYDSVFSFSSIEHSGLGRYGDPLNPNGDIETMKHIRNSLVTGGMLFLGIPVGNDALVWNVHRVYGAKRLNNLFEGFDDIQWLGTSKNYIYTAPLQNNGPQPLIVLIKKDSNFHPATD